ncbi:MAG: 50S ribosomal protein L32 [Clostridiales Family XIII bacterium]|jgi:large subunit ribosomal protein L32|nr:50S ribosomal protein L32 [Clostridiales Family XIII bacterium]
MAVPKRKTSKAKRDSRRAPNMRKTAPALSTCPHCHSVKMPHRVCPVCGYYDGKQIVAQD